MYLNYLGCTQKILLPGSFRERSQGNVESNIYKQRTPAGRRLDFFQITESSLACAFLLVTLLSPIWTFSQLPIRPKHRLFSHEADHEYFTISRHTFWNCWAKITPTNRSHQSPLLLWPLPHPPGFCWMSLRVASRVHQTYFGICQLAIPFGTSSTWLPCDLVRKAVKNLFLFVNNL